MTDNEKTIHDFYSAFAAKDFRTMQACYAPDATFGDPVFPDLNTTEAKAMWEMFCTKGKEMEITFGPVESNGEKVKTRWIARYLFSATGKQVVNVIDAEFTFHDGKIVTHRDHFDFAGWARQALGLTGRLLGKTAWLRNKVRKTAAGNLQRFMESSKS